MSVNNDLNINLFAKADSESDGTDNGKSGTIDFQTYASIHVFGTLGTSTTVTLCRLSRITGNFEKTDMKWDVNNFPAQFQNLVNLNGAQTYVLLIESAEAGVTDIIAEVF